MNLNPFAFLIETKTFPLARFQRSSLWDKIKDTYVVFYGTGEDHTLKAREDHTLHARLAPGVFEYLTFGISYFVHSFFPVAANYVEKPYFFANLYKLADVLREILPVYLFGVAMLLLFLPVFFVIRVFFISFTILIVCAEMFKICVCASLTLLVSPFVALAHVYFSLQGEGLQLCKHAYGMFDTDLMTAVEELNAEQKTDSFAFVCSEIRRRSGELYENRYINFRKSPLGRAPDSNELESGLFYAGASCLEQVFIEDNEYLKVTSQLDSEARVLGALGSNRSLSVFLQAKERGHWDQWLPEVEIRPGEENKLMWLSAILALNIGFLTERLEKGLWSRSVPFSERRLADHKTSALSLWLDLIAKMKTFNPQEIVPSEIIPEDALVKHVLAFL